MSLACSQGSHCTLPDMWELIAGELLTQSGNRAAFVVRGWFLACVAMIRMKTVMVLLLPPAVLGV
jgi:hypothetical protein